MEMTKFDCPSCGRENAPLTQTEESLQYRCGNCGMVYYGPARCADGLVATDVPESDVEGAGDWETAPPK
jgi:transcription elongation factor Elf1